MVKPQVWGGGGTTLPFPCFNTSEGPQHRAKHGGVPDELPSTSSPIPTFLIPWGQNLESRLLKNSLHYQSEERDCNGKTASLSLPVLSFYKSLFIVEYKLTQEIEIGYSSGL